MRRRTSPERLRPATARVATVHAGTTRRRVGRARWRWIGLVTVTLLALAGAGRFADPAAAGSTEVSIIDFDFVPATVSVAPGDLVVFVNHGSAVHQVVASDGSFDSGPLAPDERFSVVVGDRPVTYADARYANMVGSIAVEVIDASATTPAPATTAAPVTGAATATTLAALADTGAEDLATGAVGVVVLAAGGSALLALRRRRPRVGAVVGDTIVPGRDRDRRDRVRRPPAEF